MKIIDGGVENIGIPRRIGISPNNQWIDILVGDDDFSGYTVEYLPISAGGDLTKSITAFLKNSWIRRVLSLSEFITALSQRL